MQFYHDLNTIPNSDNVILLLVISHTSLGGQTMNLLTHRDQYTHIIRIRDPLIWNLLWNLLISVGAYT